MVNIPLVSVFITSYNQEDFIVEAVLSVVQQDYENIQIVVSDDGSKDLSPKILKNLAKKYPERIEIHLHKENRGSTWNHNYSYQQCRGEYICYFDGDDIMLPGKISNQLAFMMDHPEYCLTYHNSEIFNSDNPKDFYLWDQRFGSRTGTAKDVVRYGNFLPSLAIMFKKNTKKIEFNERILLSADWLFWIDILVSSEDRIGYLDQVLGQYRRHDGNITLDWKKKIDYQFVSLEIIDNRYPQYRLQTRKRRADVLLMKAIYLFGGKERRLARKTFFESIKLSSPNIFAIFRLPIREFFFFLRSKMKFDGLIKSLIGKE